MHHTVSNHLVYYLDHIWWLYYYYIFIDKDIQEGSDSLEGKGEDCLSLSGKQDGGHSGTLCKKPYTGIANSI